MLLEAAHMTAKSDAPRPARQNSPWLFFAKAVIVVVLGVLIYLLGVSMVQHRFFRGGWVNQHGRLMP
jgi:hypothetical protein